MSFLPEFITKKWKPSFWSFLLREWLSPLSRLHRGKRNEDNGWSILHPLCSMYYSFQYLYIVSTRISFNSGIFMAGTYGKYISAEWIVKLAQILCDTCFVWKGLGWLLNIRNKSTKKCIKIFNNFLQKMHFSPQKLIENWISNAVFIYP